RLLVDVLRFLSLGFRSRSRLVAENLFLRKQLALYTERRVRPRRADDATRIALVLLSRLIDWRAILTIVKPDTLIRWHRKGFRLWWRWKFEGARPAAAPGRTSPSGCGNGSRERHLGRRADRGRIAAQARHPGLPTARTAV